jgi:hypothetical protein
MNPSRPFQIRLHFLFARLGALVVAMLILLASCAEEPQESPNAELWRRADSLRELRRTDSLRKVARTKIIHDSIPKVTYKRLVITSRARLDSIRTTFGKSHFRAYRAFTTVNRKDIQFFRVGDTVMIPSAIHQDLCVYSVFPHFYPAADTLAKLIVVSNKLQAYACYEKGKLVRFAACNTGSEQKPTFPGRYALNWRDKLRHSSLDSTWELPWTWNFHLEAGSAFHQFEMPGFALVRAAVHG